METDQIEEMDVNKQYTIMHPVWGRVGNELFQWASLNAIACKNSANLCLQNSLITPPYGEYTIKRYFKGPFPPLCPKQMVSDHDI